jgi:hypothetical protein
MLCAECETAAATPVCFPQRCQEGQRHVWARLWQSTAFQKVVHPLCDSRSFPPRSRTADDDSNLYHLLFLPSGVVLR